MTIFVLVVLVTALGLWLSLKAGPARRLKLVTTPTQPPGDEPGSDTHAVSNDALDAFAPPPQFRLSSGNDMPGNALSVKIRQYFFGHEESSLYAELLATLAGSPYRIFPNVRLDFIFDTLPDAPPSVAGRLSSQTVEFLIVEVPEYRPVVGIALTYFGDTERLRSKRHTDDAALSVMAFQSARLPLLHIDPRSNVDADELHKLLAPHLNRN
ncbi:DUF2726 domain-containing protein [Deinococcus sp.]|uniref:DUF2726 domain-containing protein n=1 Tax=Deinococcus sp. TaxID=47478 RepID=UPI0025FBEB91|nr:DUF2726 domain-containing protein [Deinococcus sp.]